MLDRSEFSVRMERALPGVYRMVLRYTGNHSDADDLTQQAFLKAWRGKDGFQKGTDFSAWVRTIAFRLVVDWSRTRATRREVVLPPPGTLAGGDLSLPEDEEERKKICDMIRSFLDDLPDEQRIVVVMRIWEGQRTSEIAEKLSIPEGTVWWRLHQVRERLRKELTPFMKQQGLIKNSR